MTFLTMRGFALIASLLLLTWGTDSSPLQRSHPERDYPTSQKEPTNAWDPLHLMTEMSSDVDIVDRSTTLEERDTYNCTDLQANFDSRCWDQLDLSGYLMNPTTGWNHTVRICSDVENAENNDGSDCCKQGEAWTTCYLRLAHGTPGQDCSQINSQFCSYQSTLASNLDPNTRPEVQYIMKNIYCESAVHPQSMKRY